MTTTSTVANKKVAAPTAKKKKEKASVEEQIKDLKNGADRILTDLDMAPVFKHQKCKEFPSFDHAEIHSGPLLGQGGFSNVFEVSNIRVTTLDDASNHNAVVTPASGDNDDNIGGDDVDDADVDADNDDDEFHYELHTAQSHMSKRCIRFGSARYAVKRLRDDLSDLDRVRGMIDLAIEIKFFRVIWHPNIVKMRAISTTPRLSEKTFLVMDRLYGTLEHKIDAWNDIQNANQGCCMGVFGANQPALTELIKERLLVAYDLSAAIHYLHSNR
jgi:hypothetical protein